MKNLFTAFLSMFIVACSTPEKNANSKIDIYDDSVLDIIDIYSEIEVLADSISLPEGPVWDEASQSLLFVDVMGNKLYRWNENDGTSEYISPSGNTGYAPNVDFGLLGANGLLIDENGDIILCQHGDRRLAKINNSSTVLEFVEIENSGEHTTIWSYSLDNENKIIVDIKLNDINNDNIPEIIVIEANNFKNNSFIAFSISIV